MPDSNNHLQPKPVIFLASANDKVGLKYLRNIPKESKGIKNILKPAEQENLCEVVEIRDITIDDIFNTFSEYKDRIAIFHYAGHANSYQLLLETTEGNPLQAYRDGLAAFLARQNGLKFVFLNACSTELHALELRKAGIPVTIGTSQSIADDVATNLAIRLYGSIANGSSLERAWKDAVDYIKTCKGNDPRDLYGEGENDTDRFPWIIKYKKEKEKSKEWNLPDTANKPLFGLPEIPQTRLPNKPFLFLRRYERKHAEIFFGRSYYIRDLYNRVTDLKSEPIILLHGQSGVGKSSLLEAGLLPRLEETHHILYERRNQEKGLLGTLKEALSQKLIDLEKSNHLTGNANDNPETIIQLWKRIESLPGKEDGEPLPLLVILDQVEEIYTHGNKDLSRQFHDFLKALKTIFTNHNYVPKGKLILAYRKEYHPEIKEKLERYELPFTGLFLQPLSPRDIVEVVKGVNSSKRLREKYNLEVEGSLPGIIAGDLCEDKNSPVAPVLQITMAKMWESVEDDNPPHRKFKVDKYLELKKKGLLMEDFFKQQILELRKWNEEVVDSGLALSILKYHTSRLGTARIRGIDEIKREYLHRKDIIEDIVQRLKSLYLLTDVKKGKKETSLAHDTLAPIIIKEYNESDKQGQRAARILSVKIEEFKKAIEQNTIWLDEADLDIVEQGKNGMRSLTEIEIKLLQVSLAREKQRIKRKKRIRILISILAAAILISAVIAFFQWKKSEKNYKKSESNRLAILAEREVEKDPTIALRLAEKAWQLDKNEHVTRTFYRIYCENTFYKIIAKSKSIIFSAVFSPDGLYVLTGFDDQTACIWDRQGKPIQEFKGHGGAVCSVFFSPGGKYVLTGSNDGIARLWDRQGNLKRKFIGHNDMLWSVYLSPDKKYVLTGSGDKTARIWDRQGKQLQKLEHRAWVTSAVFSPDGRYILTGSEDKTACLWDWQRLARLDGLGDRQKNLEFQPIVFNDQGGSVYSAVFSPDGNYVLTGTWNAARMHDLQGNRILDIDIGGGFVYSAAFSPDGKYILTGSFDKIARIWDTKGMKLKEFNGHKDRIYSVAFSPDGKNILTGSRDQTIRLWDWQRNQLQIFRGHGHTIRSVNFSPDGNYVLTGSDDNTARLWNLQGKSIQEFKGHSDDVWSVHFSPDGKYVLTGSYDGTARLWDRQGNSIREFTGHNDAVWSVHFSPNGKFVLTGSGDKTARLWDLKGHQLRIFKGHQDSVESVAFSPNGKYVLTASEDGTVCLWDLHDNRFQEYPGHSKQIHSAAFSPKWKCILTASADNTACLWDFYGKLLQEFKGHVAGINSAVFSADGKYVLTGSEDGTARLWDLQGNQLQVFRGHEKPVLSVAFSPDGKSILTGSKDGTARIWEITTVEDFLEMGLCERLSKEQLKKYDIKN